MADHRCFRFLALLLAALLAIAGCSSSADPPHTTAATAATTATTATTTTRPPFVRHVDAARLERARAEARQRHRAAVQQALRHYPVDEAVENADDGDDGDGRALQFQTLPLRGVARDSLPDFGQLLDPSLHVTAPETPLLSRDECASVVQMAEDHFAGSGSGEWTRQTSGQYQVTGFLIKDVPAVREWFLKTLRRKIFPVLRRLYPDFVQSEDDLCVDHSYLFKYTTETGRRTDIHTDSGCLSFTIALNDEFEGGGTWFQGLQLDQEHQQQDSGSSAGAVLEMGTGQATFRVGGVKHCGHAVRAGTRYIIGGFCLHRRRPETVRLLLGDPSDRESLEAAVALNPRCDAGYNLLANLCEQGGDPAKAQEVLEYCLAHVAPHASEAAYALATLYLDQGLFHRARDLLQRVCLAVDPDDVDALTALAQCAAALGDAHRERECYSAIIATPGARAAVVAQAHCNLGVLHARNGNETDDEIDCYRQCLALNTGGERDFAARYSLACALASRGRYGEACREFRAALEGAAVAGDEGKSRENATKALRALYQAAARLLREQADPAVPLTRDEMLERFREIMGRENFAQMSALAGGGRR